MSRFLTTALLFVSFFPFLSLQGQKKTIPLNVHLNKEPVSLYLLCTNHLNFITEKKIDSVLLLNGNVEWEVNYIDSQHYTFQTAEYAYSGKLEYIRNSTLIIFFGDKTEYRISCPIIDFPPVYIKYIGIGNKPVDIRGDTLHQTDSFYASAKWSLPSYAVQRSRFYGHFRIMVQSDDTTLYSYDGWYDTGDRTRFINLVPSIKARKTKKVYLVINTKQLRTLHSSRIKGSHVPIILDKKSAEKLLVWF